MLKNKLITLISAIFVATACGGEGKVINIDQKVEDNPALISDKFNVKRGEKITFKVSFIKEFEGNMFILGFGHFEEKEFIQIIDFKQPVEVTFNGIKLNKYEGSYEDFINVKDPDTVDNKFVLNTDSSIDDPDHLALCHVGVKGDDKVSVTIVGSADYGGLQSMFRLFPSAI